MAFSIILLYVWFAFSLGWVFKFKVPGDVWQPIRELLSEPKVSLTVRLLT